MIRIEEFKVKNYKNIGEADLKLSNFNLIVGANNSGKTNFIQILSFLDFLINGAVDDVQNMMYFPAAYTSIHFGSIYPEFTHIDASISTEFYLKIFDTKNETVYQYFISIEWSNIILVPVGKIKTEYLTQKNIHKTGKATTIFHRNNNEILGVVKSMGKVGNGLQNHVSYIRILKIIPDLLSIEHSSSVKALESILKTPIFYFSSIELSKKINRIDKYGGRTVAYDLSYQISEIQKNETDWAFFEKVLDDLLGITSIVITSGYEDTEKIIEFSHGEKGSFRHIHDLSDGSLLLIALLTKILTSKHDIFLIEEPENSLHPKALLGLLDVMSSFHKEKQFIITTHSETLVSRAKPEEVIVTKIGENGMSEITNIQNIRELKRKLRNDFINFSDYVFFGESETLEAEY